MREDLIPGAYSADLRGCVVEAVNAGTLRRRRQTAIIPWES
jgi:hypothetical protein